MATYDSIHTGNQVDQATDKVLANKNKGSATTPIYLNANGEAVAITKSTKVTGSDNKLIESGVVYSELSTKYNKADIVTDDQLGDSTVFIPSQGAVKTYTDTIFDGIQPVVSAGTNITKSGNKISVNTTGLMNSEVISGKREHYGEYSVEDNSDVLDKMNREVHSTFDLSKFRVVGSPTITEDGVVHGFSISNYINVPESINAKSFTIEFPYLNTLAAADYDEYFFQSNLIRLCFFYYSANQNYGVQIRTRALASDNWSDVFPSKFVPPNSRIKIKVVYTVSNLAFYYRTVNSNWILFQNVPVSFQEAITPISLGMTPGGNEFCVRQPFDLKQFSITVNGEPVFSGNKTGIDIIKSDNNYTLSGGNPVMSDDGVLSTLSSTVTFTPSIIPDLSKPFKIFFPMRETLSGRSTLRVLRLNNNWATTDLGFINLEDFDSTKQTYSVRFRAKDTDNSTISIQSDKVLENNTLYILLLEWDGLTYSFKYKKVTDSSFTLIGRKNSIYPLNRDQACFYMVGNIAEHYDLNLFRVYVEDELVYQPLLRIPYTQTKDGKKIVDYYYQDRVESMYSQSTFTPYYSLQGQDITKFQVYGTPTISSDWVAGGFSASSCVRPVNITELIYSASNWEIDCKFTTGDNVNPLQAIIGDAVEGGVWKPYLGIRTEAPAKLSVRLSTAQYDWQVKISGTTTLLVNTTYYSKVVFTGDKYQLFLSTDNDNFNLEGEVNNSTKIRNTNYLSNLGADTYSNGSLMQVFKGSVDLKYFKIYANGYLVYEAINPSKYTMATNKPQDIIYTYQNGANKYVQRANMQLEEYGTCTDTTPVTFIKPFRDENYALTVPYSAKTKTGFTPNVGSGVTRDWKAKGFYSL